MSIYGVKVSASAILPYAISMGINYTPIPLITLGAEHRANNI